MIMSFFDYIRNRDCYECLKILADENRFSQFERFDKAKFSKKLKRLENLNSDDINYMKSKELASFNPSGCKNIIKMTKSSSWCEDLLRHIRNSIFHGRTKVKNTKGNVYFVFKDFNKNGNQSSYICLDENNFKSIFKYYQEAVNQIKKTKSYANKEYKKENAA